MPTVPEVILAIHIASANVTSAIAPRLVAIRAGLGRRSVTKQSRNARIVTVVDSHVLAMDRSLSRLRKGLIPMVVLRSRCNRRYKTHHSSRPRHNHRMVLVMTIGVAYRQHQQHKNRIIASRLLRKIPTTHNIFRVVISGGAPHGSIAIRTVHYIPAIPYVLSTTTNQCHPPHISNIGHRATHGGITLTPHTFPAPLRP
jgi:hypothetical protein